MRLIIFLALFAPYFFSHIFAEDSRDSIKQDSALQDSSQQDSTRPQISLPKAPESIDNIEILSQEPLGESRGESRGKSHEAANLDEAAEHETLATHTRKDAHEPSDLYMHLGFFSKSSALGKNEDNYGVFNASLGLGRSVQDILHFGLGVYAMSQAFAKPKNGHYDYVASKFIVNNLYAKYDAGSFFMLTAGRFHEERDWLRHYVQGISVDINYEFFNLWTNWTNDQAHANMEHLTDFTLFRENYNKAHLLAAGLGASLFGAEVEPYYYFLSGQFWSLGGKIALNLDLNKRWNSKTTLHFAHLDASARRAEKSKILWLEEAVKYRKDEAFVIFGAGFIKVWDGDFRLASLGNASRFEAHSHSELRVIEPGGLENGSQSTNMFERKAQSAYGFAGFSLKNVSLMLLGRGSKSALKTQDAYSLGLKLKVIEGIHIGGVGVFMLENKRNISYAKAYVEFGI